MGRLVGEKNERNKMGGTISTPLFKFVVKISIIKNIKINFLKLPNYLCS